MRITAPSTDARMDLDQINLADTALYTSGDAHLAWQMLRAQCPVFWHARPGGEGFWAVTRLADVRRVLAEHETFTSERGTAIAMLDVPDPAAGLMMQATDPPRHREFRQQLGQRFSAHAASAHAQKIRSLVREATIPARDGGVWDVSASFTRLPMAVGAMMMGLPDADVDPLLRLAFMSLAPRDPHFSAGTERATSAVAHFEIIQYFARQIAERRRNLSADLISHLLSVVVDGRPLTEEELLFNCLSLLLGAVVTTSQAISATLVELARAHGGEGRWPDSVQIGPAVEEALRWSSPVTHFMRRARRDVRLQDQQICEGQAVTAWIASANRDESVFARPYVLDLARSPNRHVAFGVGPHRCLGSQFARVMLTEAFGELMASIESFELAEEPSHLVSNEIAGIVSLPVRLRLRDKQAGLVSR
jgi:cytochrome P450